MRILIYAFGSRGDVQPYVALGLALKAQGHDVTVLAGSDFEAFITGYELNYHSIGNSVKDLLVNNEVVQDIFDGKVNFVKGIAYGYRTLEDFVNTMLDALWEAGQQADAVIYSTLGLAGYHLAEARGIPAIWSLTLPAFTRTGQFPNPLLPLLPVEHSALNQITHIISNYVWMGMMNRPFNRWRTGTLNLKPRWPLRYYYLQLHGKPIPRLYHFSPHLIPKPANWGQHAHVTGYCFLDRLEHWQPPDDLLAFLREGPPPVYVGFGSMAEQKTEETVEIVIDAIQKSGQRCILSSGWSGLGQGDLPNTIYKIDSAPHDWLFPHMAAVVHHCGAGTLAAGLRAGVPTVPVPFAGDQPFWAQAAGRAGVATDPILRRHLTVDRLAEAVRTATTDDGLKHQAADMGRKIRAEDGVKQAADLVERYLMEG